MNTNKEEIAKLIKFIKSMQLIIRTSPNKEQVERVKKDLYKYLKKLQSYVPDFDPLKETIDQLEKRIFQDAFSYDVPTQSKTTEETIEQSWDVKIPLKKASPHCNDPEINFLASALEIIQREFWPVLTEQHIQLDFTHSQERQSIRLGFDEIQRELKSLLETIEDYALAESPDFRDQLYKMKNKQIRLFLINTNEFLKKLKDFLVRLLQDLDKRGSIIKNPNDTITFNPQFEEATWLNGYSIRSALTEFVDLIQFILKKINLPDFKQKKF
jgi:anion-transporting  ArsA/GET3 family ATPase